MSRVFKQTNNNKLIQRLTSRGLTFWTRCINPTSDIPNYSAVSNFLPDISLTERPVSLHLHFSFISCFRYIRRDGRTGSCHERVISQGKTIPRFLNDDKKCRWLLSFTVRPLYPPVQRTHWQCSWAGPDATKKGLIPSHAGSRIQFVHTTQSLCN